MKQRGRSKANKASRKPDEPLGRSVGVTTADDKLPQRFFQPKTDGTLADKPLDPTKLEKAKSYYYTLMGWDARTGIPIPERLEELGIT